MNLKPRFEDYTEAELTQLVSEICSAKRAQMHAPFNTKRAKLTPSR